MIVNPAIRASVKGAYAMSARIMRPEDDDTMKVLPCLDDKIVNSEG
jgi:hypothetical protein